MQLHLIVPHFLLDYPTVVYPVTDTTFQIRGCACSSYISCQSPEEYALSYCSVNMVLIFLWTLLPLGYIKVPSPFSIWSCIFFAARTHTSLDWTIVFHVQLIERVLAESGDNLDFAIKRLHELRLSCDGEDSSRLPNHTNPSDKALEGMIYAILNFWYTNPSDKVLKDRPDSFLYGN